MARAHEEEPGRPGTLKELWTNRKHLEKHSKKNYFQKIIKHNYFYEFLEQVGEEKKFFGVFFRICSDKCENEVSDLQKKSRKISLDHKKNK